MCSNFIMAEFIIISKMGAKEGPKQDVDEEFNEYLYKILLKLLKFLQVTMPKDHKDYKHFEHVIYIHHLNP